MPSPSPTSIELQQIREIASRKLKQYGKSESAIRECYLFDRDFLTGIRYEAGPICFLWKSTENSALVLRGDLLIESVSVAPGFEERRAA